MTKKELTIVGAILYACEGTKLRRDYRYKNTFIYAVELTNSSPEIIALFSRFLLQVLKVDLKKVRGQLFIYPDLNMVKLVRFWSRVSSIPIEQFQKTIVFAEKTSKFKPNPLGTFKIRYNSKVDFLRLQTIITDIWRDADINLSTEEYINKGRVA